MIEEVFPPKTISPELETPRSLATRKRRRRRNSKLNKIYLFSISRWSEKIKKCDCQNFQAVSERRHSSEFRTVYEIEIRPLVSRKIRQQLFTKLSTNENFNGEISREKLRVCNSMLQWSS